jgi:hypothetical protein
MPTKRLSMRQLKEILRLHLQSQLGVRHIHHSLRFSVGVVSKILNKAQQLSLDWDAIEKLDEVQLAQLFYPRANNQLSSTMVMPNWTQVRKELTDKNVTKYLLWEEYTQQYPNSSYSYSQYCYHLANWLGKQSVPCGRFIKLAIRCSSTTQVRPCPLLTALQARCVMLRYSWPF